jgi:hypothetical protein
VRLATLLLFVLASPLGLAKEPPKQLTFMILRQHQEQPTDTVFCEGYYQYGRAFIGHFAEQSKPYTEPEVKVLTESKKVTLEGSWIIIVNIDVWPDSTQKGYFLHFGAGRLIGSGTERKMELLFTQSKGLGLDSDPRVDSALLLSATIDEIAKQLLRDKKEK